MTSLAAAAPVTAASRRCAMSSAAGLRTKFPLAWSQFASWDSESQAALASEGSGAGMPLQHNFPGAIELFYELDIGISLISAATRTVPRDRRTLTLPLLA